MPNWTIFEPHYSSFDVLGYIQYFLSESDPRPAKEQFNERYIYGGFDPFQGFTLKFDPANPSGATLRYPGDPPVKARASCKLRDETIILFRHDWVAIVQKDGSYEVARMD